MDLKSILSGKDEKESEYLWSVIIEPDWVQAGIWRIENGQTEVLSVSPASAWKTDEELIATADTALSAAVQGLPEDASEPSKTVFGVSTTWVNEGQIKPEYLEKLKKLCSELSLTPSGFVVLPEAIAHFVKSTEGSPLSAIVVGVSEENLEVSVFRKGKQDSSALVARSVSVVEDIQEGLARFNSDQEPLPSRIIIYDGKEVDLEEVREALTGVDWGEVESVEFLHTPKVEILDPEKKILATSLAGASEMADVKKVKKVSEEREETVGEVEESITTPVGEVTAEDVGFVIGEDVSSQKEEQRELGEIHVEPSGEQGAPLERRTSDAKSARAGILTPFFEKVKSSFSRFLDSVARMKFPNLRGRNRLGVIGIGLGAFFVIGFLSWWFLPRAVVTVYVSPRTLNETATIFVDLGRENVDIDQRVLPGKEVETRESGDKTTSTTGTKTVGERATGEVTLYRVGSSVTLPSGTSLNGPNDLTFTLDESVTVASGSALSLGTTNAKVTAADIGAEYNLDSGATFSVGNFGGELEAKNDNAFSGGTSREISAVSEEDQEKLVDELTEELLDKAKTSIKNKVTEGDYFIEDSLVPEIEEEDFSAIVGDEADTLRLSLALSARGLVVNRENLFEVIKEELQGEIPPGYVLREAQLNMSFEIEDENEGVYELVVDIGANLLPELSPEDISKEIAGKYFSAAQESLARIPGFTRAQINFKPNLPSFLRTLPHISKRIEIEVAAER